MSKILVESAVTRAQVFAPKEENWSETVCLHIDEEIDGMQITDGVKNAAKVKQISFFVGDVFKAMANTNSDVAAFLAAKSREQKIAMLPILLANASVQHDAEYLEDKQEFIRELTTITLSDSNLERIKAALDKLFGF